MNAYLNEFLLTSNVNQLILLGLIIMFAGVVRGCVGFGFSAIVVMTSSFWLPVSAAVTLVVFLEIIASLALLPSVKKDINYFYLVPILVGLLLTSYLGVILLANLSREAFFWIVSPYLILVATLSLAGYEYRGKITRKKLFVIGAVAGFYNGLAALAGIFIAWSLIGLKSSVRNIRATLVLFFLFSEIWFLFNAYFNDLITKKIVMTAIFGSVPLVIGIFLGSHLFSRFSEDVLKKCVLVGLIVLSLANLIKVFL